MRKETSAWLLPLMGMFVLILDAKTALLGASDGIALCLQTVIPSLFPFLALSSMVVSGLSGRVFRFLTPLGRLLKIPVGSEYIWLVGSLGGYPVGARTLVQAKDNGLSDSQYVRLMAFSCNCGPAFIFGIGAHLFSNSIWCWLTWLIHIAVSVLLALLTPGKDGRDQLQNSDISKSISPTITGAVQTMGLICGWVVLFRVLIAFMKRWFLWALPQWAQIVLMGMLELSNGCTALYAIEDEASRFVLFSMFLGFGGLCVTLQTLNICKDIGMYIPGKLMHCILSGLIAATVVFPKIRLQWCLLGGVLCVLYYFICRILQKKLDFHGILLYDIKKHLR